MEKRILFEADIDERGLQPIFEIAHLALEDAADQTLFGRALDVELLELSFLEHGDALERFGIDDHFLVRFLPA